MRRQLGATLEFALKEIVTSDTYNGMTTGDRVRIPNHPTHSNLSFEFVRHSTNIVSGKQWVDLWGGKTGHQGWLSVKPADVVKVDTRRKQ